LGWVYFAKGDLGKAESLVAAAHHERLDGRGYHVGLEAGDLCQLSRILAVADICEALSAERPPIEVRGHLARAAGGDAGTDALVAEHRGDLSRDRTIALPGKGPAGKRADFLVLFAAPGRVDAVKFVTGDEEMRALLPALQKISADAIFPDETPRRSFAAASRPVKPAARARSRCCCRRMRSR
jgi:hypothetical protein